MKTLFAGLRVIPWGMQTLYEAHQYAHDRRRYRQGFADGYAAGKRHQEPS